MPMQQDVSRLERRQMVLMKHMPVGEIEQPAAQGQHPIIGQDGKRQHHLVHFTVTVSPHAEEAFLSLVQHSQNFFGRVFPGQIISGPMVQKISQQDQPVSLVPVPRLE